MKSSVTIKAPISYTGSDGHNEVFEPANPCPETWGETVMGRNLCGATGPAPDNQNPQATTDRADQDKGYGKD